MKKHYQIRLACLCWIISMALIPFVDVAAQTTSQTSFGKNRVQYSRQIDEWLSYETANFITYWYGDARNIAQSALQMAEFDYPEIQQLLEHQTSDKIEMLVFSDLSDLKQSNIGEDDVFLLKAGETKVVGNKVFVFFDGDHRHLREQIREGMSGVMINSMLYGSSFQEIVQNAVLLNLPSWFVDGLSAYAGEAWSIESDNRLRDALLFRDIRQFDQLVKYDARLAGQAFWHYVSLHYGKGTVSNLLYLTRINRSIDAGFLYVLGIGYRPTTQSMLDYFTRQYKDESQHQIAPDDNQRVVWKTRRKHPISHIKLSPDGQKIAWINNDIGRWRVRIHDLATGKTTVVLKGGARNALQATDYNYPLIAWNPDNQRLAVLYERRDVPRLAQINLATGKKEVSDLSPEFQRVYAMQFVSPGELAFSAANRGYTDLFLYRTVNKQTERLTNDFWDDLDVSVGVLDGKRGLMFASNRMTDTLSAQRLDTILPIGNFDLFFYELDARNPELTRLTQTPFSDERFPFATDSTHFTFLSNESGLFNRHQGELIPYIAWHQKVFYLKDGAEVKSLDTQLPAEWPMERLLKFLAPADSVLKNLDSTQIDSVRSIAVWKKRANTYNTSNYDRTILQQHVAQRAGKLAELVFRNGEYSIYTHTTSTVPSVTPRTTRTREIFLQQQGLPLPPKPEHADGRAPQTPVKQEKLRPQSLITDTLRQIEPGWLFQVPEYLLVPPPTTGKIQPTPGEPGDDPNLRSNRIVLQQDSIPVSPRRPARPFRNIEIGKNNSVLRFFPPQIVPYRTKFRTDYVSTDMDNSLLFEGLQRYDGPGSQFNTPPPGVLVKANFKDLLDNYVLEAGFRLPTTFNGMEYYLWFDNKKYRIDRRYALYRKTQINLRPRPQPISPNLPDNYQERLNTFMGMYELRYPLDVFTSLRSSLMLRQDRSIALSSDQNTLETPDYREQRVSLRLSAVFDNTVDVDLNLKTGSRAKIYTEIAKRFDLNIRPDLSLKFNKGFMTIIGMDARHYQMLDRRSQVAFRLAGATSFGSEKMLYILGGVDNWIFPKFNESITLPDGEGYAYQTLSTNVRGFKQNIRNGNSFVVMNTELRVPVFKYLIHKPSIGNFWRNFQVTGFFDVGTAWQGRSLYAGDNPINIVPISNPPTVNGIVRYFREPLVAGYGAGVRALIFGMYLRADYAWGIETRKRQEPILHVALGTDF
ncbi:MAG: hypothetical protein IT269_13900 [Saprospiraceae bacterium]|nr:hypothetical protein [Saprospiraceae bacterium]